MIFIIILIIKSIDKKMLLGFFFCFLILRANHRVFACITAISWAPTDCDTQAEEVETTLASSSSSSSSSSFIGKMVRRLRSRILIDYRGMCVKKREREAQKQHTTQHIRFLLSPLRVQHHQQHRTSEDNTEKIKICLIRAHLIRKKNKLV